MAPFGTIGLWWKPLGVVGRAEQTVPADGFGILWWLRLPFAPPLNWVFGDKVPA